MSKSKKLARKVFSFPFKLTALLLGMMMMVSVFFMAMINGKSIDDYCEKVDMIMDKLEELKVD